MHRNIHGSIDLDTFETELAQTIDNDIPHLLRRIIPKVGQSVTLSSEDKETLALFLSLSMTRVPSFVTA